MGLEEPVQSDECLEAPETGVESPIRPKSQNLGVRVALAGLDAKEAHLTQSTRLRKERFASSSRSRLTTGAILCPQKEAVGFEG